MVEVTQEDRNAYDDLMSDDLYDHPPHAVWYFTRHRIAALAAKEAEIAKLREGLEKARKIIRDIEDYMARPERGDWEAECAAADRAQAVRNAQAEAIMILRRISEGHNDPRTAAMQFIIRWDSLTKPVGEG